MRARTAFLLALLYLGVIAYLITYAPHVKAGDEWTADQRTQASVLAGLLIADWAQTRQISRHPNRWSEQNPVIGSHPSTRRVDTYFISSIAIGYLLLDAMPSEYRNAAINAGIVLEAGVVGHNLNLGLGINF